MWCESFFISKLIKYSIQNENIYVKNESTSKMKKVRILLRVSSDRQLDVDGDLSIQRKIIKEYIKQQEDWVLDGKEYFEGSNSGYTQGIDKRAVLLEALEDARKGEYEILAVYKMIA